jgi:hypothetical protein
LTQTWKTTIEAERERKREETNAERRYEVRRREDEDQDQDGDGHQDERVILAGRIEVPEGRKVSRVEREAETGRGAEVRVEARVRTRRDHDLRISPATLQEQE